MRGSFDCLTGKMWKLRLIREEQTGVAMVVWRITERKKSKNMDTGVREE